MRTKKRGDLINTVIDKLPIDIPKYNWTDVDKQLKDIQGVKAKNAKFSEKVPSCLVKRIIKMKRKIGAGVKTTTLKKIISAARKVVKKSKARNINTLTKQALLAAKKEISGKKVIGHSRVLKVPKISGGFLQAVIPILSGLSALGSIVGGVSGIAKAIADFKAAKNSNKTTKITTGEGLYINPYKKGFGIVSKN